MRSFIRGLAYAVLAGVFVALVAVGTLASDGSTPWDDLTISFGGTALAWGAVVAAVIQLGKAIRVNGSPLLGTAQTIWLANLVLGGLGMFLYAYMGGATVLSALLQAVLAVLGASGTFEAVATAVGKGNSTGPAS